MQVWNWEYMFVFGNLSLPVCQVSFVTDWPLGPWFVVVAIFVSLTTFCNINVFVHCTGKLFSIQQIREVKLLISASSYYSLFKAFIYFLKNLHSFGKLSHSLPFKLSHSVNFPIIIDWNEQFRIQNFQMKSLNQSIMV